MFLKCDAFQFLFWLILIMITQLLFEEIIRPLSDSVFAVVEVNLKEEVINFPSM